MFMNTDVRVYIADKQFGRLHTLQGHMHIHEDSKPHICFCGATFTLRGNCTFSCQLYPELHMQLPQMHMQLPKMYPTLVHC